MFSTKRTILFIICLLSFRCGYLRSDVNVENGILEIEKSIFFDEYKYKALDGEWFFFPNEFVEPENIEERISESELIKVNAHWNRQPKDGKDPFLGQGYGTYYLKIILNSKSPQELSLRLMSVSSAYRLIINGETLSIVGFPGKSIDEEIPFHKTQVVDLPVVNKNTIDIILHVSNFHHSKGGLWDRILIGSKAAIHQIKDFHLIQESVLIGALLVMGFYHLGLYILVRTHLPTLLFTLFAFSFAIRIFLTGEMLIEKIFPELSFSFRLKAEYINLAASAFFGMIYFHFTYRKFFSKSISSFLSISLLIFTLFVLGAQTLVFSRFLFILQLIILFIVVYSTISLLLVFFKEHGESKLIILGILIWGSTILYDILIYMNYINSEKLSSLGLSGFLIIQAYLLAKHFNKAIVQSAALTSELTETYSAYDRFVPKEFLSLLGKDKISMISVGDVIRTEASVLFCDIRSFTSLTEKSKPEALFRFLNSYFYVMNQIIIKHNGIIDKYMGDAILAVFPKKCEDALNCAIEIQFTLSKNKFRLSDQEIFVNAGIALHYGDLLLGVIGGEKLLQTTVISDTVNTCSRLQSLTKTYGANIIISEMILQSLEDPSFYNIRFLDHASVLGKEDTIYICEIYDHEDESQINLKTRLKPEFDKGVMVYQSGDYEKAWKIFIEVLKENPLDGPCTFYLNRSALFLVKGITLIHESEEKLVKWEKNWETGIKLIDEQHKLLFDIINELNKALKFNREREVMERIIENLKIYVYTHFAMEESLMLRYDYPDFENHKIQHKKFIDKMDNAALRYKNNSELPTYEILEFLKDWLIAHIKKSDKEGYVPYVLQRDEAQS